MADATSNSEWTQTISALYRQLAQIAVPARAEQIATLLTLIPFDADAPVRVVELASGEGYLSQAIARAFPQAHLIALDYEQSMRQATALKLGDRATVLPFDIRRDDWFEHLAGADVVVSSLCIHHLNNKGKQRLFKEVQANLSKQGALLIADIVAPQTQQANQLFGATWDAIARQASQSLTGSSEAFTLFQREEWNVFQYPDPEMDMPSPLSSQLGWLYDAGFAVADCWWMRAGHAIYGGYKQAKSGGITYVDALAIARDVLNLT